MALWYAWGPYEVSEGKPASAFSKGDPIMYNSSSSLSGLPQVGQTTGDIAGVAMCDSTQSVNGIVTFVKVTPQTVFWSDATPGSTFTRGAKVNFNYGAKRWQANGSSGTVLAVAERAIADIEGQSVQSRVLVRFGANNSAGTLVHGD